MRKFLKQLANGMAIVAVLPAWLLYSAASLMLGRDRAFPGWSQCMSLIPGLTGSFLRRAFYRLVLRQCGEDSWIGFGAIFASPEATIGKNAYIGAYCCLGAVTIEEDVLLASFVSVTNGSSQHGIARLDMPIREQPGTWPRVTVGRDSWIGERAVILANVGKHCVIGAGSVVTQPIPDYAIAVGTPAKVVRYREGMPAAETSDPK